MDQHTRSYSDFIRMGDTAAPAPTSDNTSAARPPPPNLSSSDPGRGYSQSTPSTPRVPSTSATNLDTATLSSTSASSGAQHQPARDSPAGFFSSIFRKATTTIESSIQAAHANGSEALRTAEQHVTAASTSAISTVTGLVLDLGTSFNSPNNNSTSSSQGHNGSSSDPNTNNLPESTRTLKALRVPPPATPLLLFHSPVPTVVSQSTLHIFTQPNSNNTRPTPVPLNIVQTRISSNTSPAPPHAAVAATHATILPGPRLAVAHDDGCVVVFSLSASRVAAFEAATPPHPSPTTALAALHPAGLAVARRDGSVHLLNTALQPVHSLPAPDLCAAPLTPSLTSAAAVVLTPIRSLPRSSSASSTTFTTTDAQMQPQNPSTSTITSNPNLNSKNTALAVAYDNGTVCTFSSDGSVTCVPFLAHAGAPAAVTTLFDSTLIITAGNPFDRCLAVFDRYTGRCLARRMIQYTPTSLHTISSPIQPDTCGDSPVCPSASTLLVGGDEAQVEVFRIVAVSAHKVDIKLIKTLVQKQRGKKRSVIQVDYRHDAGATLSAVCENGDLRRLQLGRGDAAQLCLLEEDRWTGATYTENNISDIISEQDDQYLSSLRKTNDIPATKQTDTTTTATTASTTTATAIETNGSDDNNDNDNMIDPTITQFSSSVHVSSGVIHAQGILATILDDQQVPEDRKDALVTTFQQMQTEMRSVLLNADKDVRRARRRIFGQFAAGVKDPNTYTTPLEIRLKKETKRAAAFEAEYVTRRYVEHSREVERVTVEKMKKLLSEFLGSLNTADSLILQQALRDVDMLGTEDAEVEVD